MVNTAQDWLDAQISVLGSVLISPEVAAMVVGGTNEEDYTGQCRTVFAAIRDLFLAGKPADPVMVRDKLGEPYTDYLMQLMEVTPTAANVEQYISLVRKRSRLFRLRDIGERLQALDNDDDAGPLLSEANQLVIQRTRLQPVTMEQALTDFYGRHTDTREYLSWPIPQLNEKLFVEAGDFVVIGGYPSAGKSALALQCAYHMAENKRVGFFSLETSAAKLMDRTVSSVCSVDMGRLKRSDLTDADWSSVAQASDEICERQLEFIPAANLTVAEIRARAFANRYDVIIIDYLQLIRAKGSNRVEQVTNISIDLHTMAQSTGITVIALSQLSRPDRTSGGKETAPTMASLRESGQIEQDADIIFLLYRSPQHPGDATRNLDIAKNKDGETGRVYLSFDGAHQSFARISNRQAPEGPAGKPPNAPYQRLPDATPIPEQFYMEV